MKSTGQLFQLETLVPVAERSGVAVEAWARAAATRTKIERTNRSGFGSRRRIFHATKLIDILGSI
jgi:hypothetical protein